MSVSQITGSSHFVQTDRFSQYPLLIITSAVNGRIVKTPLTQIAGVDPPVNYKFFLKREEQQLSFSAHVRGAYNRMSQIPPEERWRGIVFSAVGYEKYAKAIAWASRLLQMQVTIAVSQAMSAQDIKELRSLGCAVVQAFHKINGSQIGATLSSVQEQVPHVEPLADPYYLAGIGTVGLEILQQTKEGPPLEAIFCSLQDRATLEAIGIYLNRFAPQVKVIGVGLRQSSEPCDQGPFKPLPAILREIAATSHFIEALSNTVLVDTRDVLKAIADVFGETRVVVDLDSALAVAGMKQYAINNGRSDGATRSLVAVTSSVDVAFDSFMDSIRVG
ncbi:threonine dehydratase [Aspergillus affinis]|uniref:threonine dehydratase n=1 Tax=Aspergillus affinis TaxID=1070780 RepID=UPI0022FE9A4A|nr:threonine dehydratase [Aspergillus affinis]KAI9042082.1 threonine dehydratase [Aspergillus affinis]